jgi:hypothetical protein
MHANQAPTPTDLEQNHMPEADHDDQSTQDTSNLVEIAGVEVSPFICCSAGVIKNQRDSLRHTCSMQRASIDCIS